MSRCFVIRFACVSAFVFTSAVASAQGSVEAEELFRQGRALLAEGRDLPLACTKLAESNRLERAVGTLFSLAQCEEAQGKVAAARTHYQEAADFADALQDRLNRGPIAHEKAAALDGRIARLTIQPQAGAPVGMSVKTDGTILTSASFGSALPVDPGKHVVIASAEGRAAKSFEIELVAGDSKVLEVEPGDPLPLSPPATALAGAEQPAPSTVPESTSGVRYASYAGAGIGVVGLVVGGIFGGLASSTWSDAKAECKPGACGAGSKAQADRDSAGHQGNIATGAFIVGGVALAAGIALFVFGPATTCSSNSANALRNVVRRGGSF